jgi:hypothetical protein
LYCLVNKSAKRQQCNVHPSMVTWHWNTLWFVVFRSKRIMFWSYIFARRMGARIPTNHTFPDTT